MRAIKDVPFLLPFDLRAELFRHLIRTATGDAWLFVAHRCHDFARAKALSDECLMPAAGGGRSSASGRRVNVRNIVQAKIRRHHILEDGFRELYKAGHALRYRLQITFISDLGYEEPGIDGGGTAMCRSRWPFAVRRHLCSQPLAAARGSWVHTAAGVMKEFLNGFACPTPSPSAGVGHCVLTAVSPPHHLALVRGGGSLVKEAFDPKTKLFALTADHRLYPNPWSLVDLGTGTSLSAVALWDQRSRAADLARRDLGWRHTGYAEHALQLYRFIGRILGKLLLEGVIVDLPLAGFFLNALLRRPNSCTP